MNGITFSVCITTVILARSHYNSIKNSKTMSKRQQGGKLGEEERVGIEDRKLVSYTGFGCI